MISKKRYWGLALPIYDCAGVRHVRGDRQRRRSCSERAVEGWDVFEGHSPHRPWIDAVKIACATCGEIVSRIPDVGNPWLDAGIVPFSTLQLPPRPRVLGGVVPGRLHHRGFPGQFRNWFYSLLTMRTALDEPAAVQDGAWPTPWCATSTARRCTRARATRSGSTTPPTAWASTSCAGCSCARTRRQPQLRLRRPPTRCGAACS